MKTLHFDCCAGISGDMTLGALVDLGVDPAALIAELRALGLDGWHLEFTRDERCGIYGTRAVVHLEDGGTCTTGSHEHRAWREIRALLAASGLRGGAKERALAIFERLACAEAAVHGCAPEDVCFHEVGALDSIIDIAGAAVCLDLLAPDAITASRVELGGGFVRCAHGTLPVPAPAVIKLCEHMPVSTGGFDKEMTTPTGAAILAASVDEFTEAASFTALKTAYGIGERVFDKPNLLQVSWRSTAMRTAMRNTAMRNTAESGCAADGRWREEALFVIETNIDDMTGEELAFLMERLFESGALDVTLTPCIMKKGRPATTVSALTGGAAVDALAAALFGLSSALGVKVFEVRRLSLERQLEAVETALGTVRVKTAPTAARHKIEFEDRAALARSRGISLEAARL
ncbi:MAG: nickel pincer cofactor biosynthesis protein LarC, partial [Spirochaetaceae bacterium]|nr:nickel pincer cofactor biosynthesis protein LarC [Spirochaetaceae bacterium]